MGLAFLILMVIVVPVLVGILWVVCVGGFIWLCMTLWKLLLKVTLNPALRYINNIPFIGRIIDSIWFN